MALSTERLIRLTSQRLSWGSPLEEIRDMLLEEKCSEETMQLVLVAAAIFAGVKIPRASSAESVSSADAVGAAVP